MGPAATKIATLVLARVMTNMETTFCSQVAGSEAPTIFVNALSNAELRAADELIIIIIKTINKLSSILESS